MLLWKKYILAFFIVIAVLQYRLWFGETGIIASNLVQDEIKQTFQRIKKLQQVNENLREQASFYEDNPQALEGVARKYLGLTRSNETLIKIKKSFVSTPTTK